MKIVKLKVMRGPNCWSSAHHQLIVLKINPEGIAAYPYEVTDDIIKSLSSLHIPDNLIYPGQSLIKLIGAVAVALQQQAGIECIYFAGESPLLTDTDVIFPYVIESAGKYAAHAAVRIINTLLSHLPCQWKADVLELNRLRKREGLGPSTKAIADAAIKRNIPITRLDNDSLLMLGHGANQHMIQAAVASTTSSIAVELAQDKHSTKKLLETNHVPIPQGAVIDDLEELVATIEDIGFPLVIKPSDGNHGRGITTMIKSQAEAVKAFQVAQQISEDVIIEKHIEGHDYRFLVINYELIAVAKRTPAMVTGDGVSTIAQLIERVNKDPKRGSGHDQVLTAIAIDEDTMAILATLQLTPDSVLTKDRTLHLKSTANLSTGGTAEDVTDYVHPHNKALAERVARLMNLNICGIDMIAATVSEPITEANGAILEVNAGPGLRMHIAPSKGTSRDVGGPIIDMLYPDDAPARIPLIAVTGTNGKTTTTRLIAHLAKEAGYHTGFTTTDGIYINDQLIATGDCSGPQSARVVLRDPLIEFAVLECARGGILRSGLGFDECGVGIVTNISADHLGMDGIDTIEQLAQIKGVVPQSVGKNGLAILNADDDLVYHMKDSVQSNIALFGLNSQNLRITQHMADGKLAAFIEDDWFVISNGEHKRQVAHVEDVPLTFKGTAQSMIKNVLPAILAAYIYNIPVNKIQEGLRSFMPTPEHTPGRMNLFAFNNFSLMLDYAHNEGGYNELRGYANKITASVKTGVIAATGDRRDQDIRNLGRLCAEIFDELIIRHDKDGRGRTNEEITGLLLEGIKAVKPNMPVMVISDEIEAIEYAIKHAEKNAWIFVNTDNVQESLDFISRIHSNNLLHNQENIVSI